MEVRPVPKIVLNHPNKNWHAGPKKNKVGRPEITLPCLMSKSTKGCQQVESFSTKKSTYFVVSCGSIARKQREWYSSSSVFSAQASSKLVSPGVATKKAMMEYADISILDMLIPNLDVTFVYPFPIVYVLPDFVNARRTCARGLQYLLCVYVCVCVSSKFAAFKWSLYKKVDLPACFNFASFSWFSTHGFV